VHIYATVTPATCDKDGLQRCTKCELETSIKAIGHDYDGATPSHFIGTLNGYLNGVYTTYVNGATHHKYLCKNCNEVYKLEPHNWENDGKYIDYSLAEHKMECKSCRAMYYYEHSFKGTYIDENYHLAACKNCTHTHQDVHELYPDDIKRWINETYHMTGCVVCNREWDEGHTWVATDGGYHCSVCDKNKEHVVATKP
jgi:hypothetical protein